MKNLSKNVNSLIELVEFKTGIPIQIITEPDLKVMASITIARNGSKFHVLRYKPTNESLDYLITYQIGFVLRLYENPKEERFDLSSKNTSTLQALNLLRALNSSTQQDATKLQTFAEMIKDWSLVNIRSLPVGMRINDWILQTYPELLDQMRKNIHEQQMENLQLLSMNFGGYKIPHTLLTPLAAYALFADKLSNSSIYTTPYALTGLLEGGQKLMQIYNEINANPTNDKAVIDQWANEISIADWYEWIAYKP